MGNDDKQLNEPSASYGLKFPYHSIRPSSFEALEEENRQYSMSLTPVERLAYLHQLNINAYGRESLMIKSFGTKIIVK